MPAGLPLYLLVLLEVVLPIAVGILVTQWAVDRAKRRHVSPAGVQSIRLIITLIWVVIAGAGATITLGPLNPLSTLTASAVAGVAVTLALQTTLQNIVAGFLILRRGFLHVGDDILISGTRGRVASLGIVNAVLKMADGTLAIVSNSTLFSGPLINYTATTRLAGEY